MQHPTKKVMFSTMNLYYSPNMIVGFWESNKLFSTEKRVVILAVMVVYNETQKNPVDPCNIWFFIPV